MSRGLKNFNPGNIRLGADLWRGEVTPSRDAAFRQFASPAWGYRAMFVVLDTYRRRYGIVSLRGIIARYAPPSENDTEGYLRFVAGRAGIADVEAPLDRDDGVRMRAVVGAMSRMENGVEAVAADVEAGWELFVKYRK